uniref:Uncharacterized protein n=1 Tax=Eutreptiella gymnastica TaxID=73025 RepID=A0A7S4FU09_9EUGL
MRLACRQHGHENFIQCQQERACLFLHSYILQSEADSDCASSREIGRPLISGTTPRDLTPGLCLLLAARVLCAWDQVGKSQSMSLCVHACVCVCVCVCVCAFCTINEGKG